MTLTLRGRWIDANGMGEPQEASSIRSAWRGIMAGEHVLICVAWPYANGPLHLGHVAGCYLPPDIQYRFERAMGNRVDGFWLG